MQNLADLKKQFPLPGVTIEPGQGGLPRVAVRTPVAEADIYLHGAHVTHFQPRGQKPVLFTSAKSHFAAGKAIRGGVPMIFPWFGPKADDAKAPQHGFVRSVPWTLAGVSQAGDAVAVKLTFGPSDATRQVWPHEFELAYTVTVGRTLELALEVKNTGPTPFTFDEALHTYLAVADVRRATIDGLGGREFIDKVDAARRKTQPPGPFEIEGETDRVYLNTPDPVVVADPAGGRRLTVAKSGSNATVVWNPWVAKAKALADFGDDEWPGMVCVETVNAADNAVTLPPGQTHVMRATIEAA